MKSIKGWNNWYIHPFTMMYILISIINNNFFNYISALMIVCIHEYGHYYFAKKFNFEIEKVEIFPFGAFLSVNDYGMHHVCEELIMLMAGLSVFIFNFLTIYPLDGSKILLLLLSLIKDYYQAIKLQIKISLFALSILIVLYNKIGYLLVYFYLLYANYEYIKEFRYMIIRLYLKRMQGSQYKHCKINYNFNFYRPYYNIYVIDGKTYNERQMLQFLIKKLKTD